MFPIWVAKSNTDWWSPAVFQLYSTPVVQWHSQHLHSCRLTTVVPISDVCEVLNLLYWSPGVQVLIDWLMNYCITLNFVFCVWLTVHLELYLHNKPTRWTVYPHCIEMPLPFRTGPPTDDLNKYRLPHTHLLPPNDGLQLSPKYVEAWYFNKVRTNSASCSCITQT
jgi:hypothetical protein